MATLHGFACPACELIGWPDDSHGCTDCSGGHCPECGGPTESCALDEIDAAQLAQVRALEPGQWLVYEPRRGDQEMQAHDAVWWAEFHAGLTPNP